jgi:molecular chaperone HscB
VAAPSGPETRPADFFSFLGLPRKLRIEMNDLEQRYRALSRQFHPDYFYNATPAERRASLERSSYLNDAYRTLKAQATRVEYLLKLEGLETGEANTTGRSVAPPPGLLEEVFALNEELDEIREMRAGGAPDATWRGRLELARKPIAAAFCRRCASDSWNAITSVICCQESKKNLATNSPEFFNLQFAVCILQLGICT